MVPVRVWYCLLWLALPFSAQSWPAQSTSQRAVTEIRNSQAFKAIEHKLLNSMGMKTRPRPRKGQRIPQYMIDLYNSHEQHPDWISTKFRFNNEWTSANTVRAYHHQDGNEVKLDSTPGQARIKFDVSTLPVHEKVTSAELRMLSPGLASTANVTQLRVDVYHVIRPGILSRPAITRLLDSRMLNTTRTSDWLVFDVRSALQYWVDNPLHNYGLEIHVSTQDGRVVNDALRMRRHSTMDEEKWHDERPLVIAFNHDDSNHHHVRRKRSLRTGSKRTRPQYCQRHPLYVDFSDVGWNDWIVAPPGYYAFYCNGVCRYPIAKHLNATNHAIVQTIMNTVDKKVPTVCCVPTTLTPISMLYLDDYEKVVLKNYQEMVVEGCGCR